MQEKSFTVRPLTIADYDGLFALWNAVPETKRALKSQDDSREGISRYLARNQSTCFAACDESGRIVGAILAGHDGRRGIFHHLCVHPDFRRCGIARALVNRAESALLAEGIRKIFLVAFSDNDGANDFWEAQGYTLRTDLNYRNKVLENKN